MITPSEFLKTGPFVMAHRLADRDLRGTATTSEVQWLYDHPLMWLKGLARIHLDVKDAIAKSKKDLTPLRPRSGTNPSQAYLDAHTAWLDKRTSRIHFQGNVARKIEEVKSLINADHFSSMITVGDLIEVFMEFDQLVDDDEVSVIQAKAQYWIRKLSQK